MTIIIVYNTIMKKALKLALVYLINLIVCTVIGTLLYSLYLNLLGFVAGREIKLFNDAELFRSLFYIMFCMLILILPLISYYRVRHPGGVLQFVVYLVLCILTWALLMPCCFKLRDFCLRKVSFEIKTESLSPNYFRQIDDDVYFFTREFRVKQKGRAPEAPVIIIDTSENGSVEFKTIGDYPNQDINKKALPFREVQVKKIFGEKENPVPFSFRTLISMIEGGYTWHLSHLLTLISFVILLCSVYGVTNLFDWRLLNTIMLFIITAAILTLNSVYFNPQFDSLKSRINSFGLFVALGGVVSEPLLFITNLFFTLLFITTGTIKFVVHRHSQKIK